jgi:hypothetical protein
VSVYFAVEFCPVFCNTFANSIVIHAMLGTKDAVILPYKTRIQ